MITIPVLTRMPDRELVVLFDRTPNTIIRHRRSQYRIYQVDVVTCSLVDPLINDDADAGPSTIRELVFVHPISREVMTCADYLCGTVADYPRLKSLVDEANGVFSDAEEGECANDPVPVPDLQPAADKFDNSDDEAAVSDTDTDTDTPRRVSHHPFDRAGMKDISVQDKHVLVILDNKWRTPVTGEDGETPVTYRTVGVREVELSRLLYNSRSYPSTVTGVEFIMDVRIDPDGYLVDDPYGTEDIVRQRPISLCFPLSMKAEAEAKASAINVARDDLARRQQTFDVMTRDEWEAYTGVPVGVPGWSAEGKRITRILHEDEKAAAKADAIWAELEEREGKA